MIKPYKALIRQVRQRAKLVLALSIGLVIGGAGSAAVFAAIPDASGKIHACYSTGILGRLRVIDSPSQSCNGNETAISWDQSAGPGKFLEDLSGKNFTDASLHARDFANVDMHGSDFTRANLTSSNMSGANFSGASIGGVKIIDAIAEGANFNSATVANLGLSFDNTNFNNADFSNIQFRTQKMYFDGATFQGANFSNSSFGYITSPTTTSDIMGLDLRGATITNVTFAARDTLANANFEGLDLSGNNVTLQPGIRFDTPNFNSTNFSNMQLNGVQFGGGTAASANFSNVQFTDANLVSLDMSTSDITGATWTNTICPDGTNSENNGNTCIGHLAP